MSVSSGDSGTTAAGVTAPLETATSATPAVNVRYVLFILLVVYIFNFLDRQIVAILAEPIKRDLDLSDTQIGLMTGLAFALFYTFLGIPLARYADRSNTNRVGLIAISLAVWSGFTALCGIAHNFTQLLLARIGVGVGEAGCTPAAHSLITDLVPKEKRASAISFYGLGIPIGSLLGTLAGGFLADSLGWRSAFLVVGVPGVLLSILIVATIRDPRRIGLVAGAPKPAAKAQMPLSEALREMGRSPAFIMITAATAVVAFLGYGKGVWALILFIRTHGLSASEAALYLGLTTGLAGMFGTWLGGYAAERFGKRDAGHQLTPFAIGMVLVAPILYLGYAETDWRWSIPLLLLPAIVNSMYYGPSFACVQGLVVPQARAMAAAVVLFVINLVGLGLGPLGFGMLSDALKPIHGGESVRMVLVVAAWMGIIPSIIYWMASRRLDAELKEVERRTQLLVKS